MNAKIPSYLRSILFAGLVLALILTISVWFRKPSAGRPDLSRIQVHGLEPVSTQLNAAFAAAWREAGIEPAGRADNFTVIRRLGLALTGTIPSLEQIRVLEQIPAHQQIAWWLDHLLASRRCSDYLAERFARVFVGANGGPLLLYRRRRLVHWLSDQLLNNRPYHQLARSLIASQGIWTTQPEANFITKNIQSGKGPDHTKLAARLTRAFLGIRIDCVQCHDDFLENRWRQEDFHRLAAFFREVRLTGTGIRDDPDQVYQYRLRGQKEDNPIEPAPPYQPNWLPAQGTLRERLAHWVTHSENRAFARTAVNRAWAIMFGRALAEPIDSISLDGPYPPGMEVLADDFVAHNYDLQRLLRVIAGSDVFCLQSRPAVADDTGLWAAFPLTRLRPEQVAMSLNQAASLQTIDRGSHIVQQLRRRFGWRDFVRRWGDLGEAEFEGQSGTIPQRLLMMNGKMVHEHTKNSLLLNAASRIGFLTGSPAKMVETAYYCVFTRPPTDEESAHFRSLLQGTRGEARAGAMQDLYWALLNSTEFSWNH